MTAHTELAADSVYGEEQLREAMDSIDVVVSFTSFADKFTKDTSDIIIPVSTHYETQGSFIDMFGNVRKFDKAVKPYAENKELWRILRVLGNLLGLDDFDYNAISEVTEDAYQTRARVSHNHITKILNANLDIQKEIAFVVSNPMYDSTSLLRRSKPLQLTKDAQRFKGVRISQEFADELGLKKQTGKIKVYNIDNDIELDVTVDESLQAKNFLIPRKLVKDILFADNTTFKLLEGGE